VTFDDPRFSDDHFDGMRFIGDDPADAVAIALLTAYGVGTCDEGEVVAQAIGSIMQGLASPDDAVNKWLTEGPVIPAWADPGRIAAGQRFFDQWTLPIVTCLFCVALPSTLAAPHGAAVLAATSDLGSPRTVAARLAGTGRMLFDALTPTPECSLEVGRQGHRSVLCVRLLHAVVRQALLSGRGRAPWDAAHGTPVNQEDLLGALLAFSVAVLDGLTALGIRVADEEADAYLHTWSVIGSLLGVHEDLLPLDPGTARALAARVAARQLGAGPDGPRLARPLYGEMRRAMPLGFGGVPGAVTWRLAPEVAGLLALPRPRRLDRRSVDVACAVAATVQRVPWLRRIAVGPGSKVGRHVLVSLMDDELRGRRPRLLVESPAARDATARGPWGRLARWLGRDGGSPGGIGSAARPGPVAMGGATGAAGGAIGGTPQIPPPVDAAAIEAIASEGYPFWEPVADMVVRNRRITTAYAELSRRLARAIAGPQGRRDTNWCTYASWTSATVGRHIATIPPPRSPRGLGRGRGRDDDGGGPAGAEAGPVPSTIPGALAPEDDTLANRIVRSMMRRGNGTSFRILAAGNRVVFLNVGLSVVAFLKHFPSREAATRPDAEQLWDRFWSTVERQDDELALADPSWVFTPPPVPRDLYLGFRQYFLAMQADDEQRRSQHVLAGNLLVAAYEQRRLDGYVWAALGPRSEQAMRRLTLDDSGTVGGVRRRLTGCYARAVTRRLRLHLPGGEVLRIDRPVPLPEREADRWPALESDDGVTLPALQALISRYLLAADRRAGYRSRNWTSYDERMRTVGYLFRVRQRQDSLFGDPLAPPPGG
jgi:hypothetical protein